MCLRKLFRKNVKLNDKLIGGFVIPQKLRGGKVKLNTLVEVPEDFAFAITSKGKVLDIFPSGKHEFNALTLKESTKKFSLAKPDKDGKFTTMFKANAYYITLNPYKIEWKTYKKVHFNSKKFDEFKAKISGYIELQVVDTKRFLQELLYAYDYLKPNEGVKIIQDLLSESITNRLNKQDFDAEEFFEETTIKANIFDYLKKKFAKFGGNVVNFQVCEYNLPKNVNFDIQPRQTDIDGNASQTFTPFAPVENYEPNNSTWGRIGEIQENKLSFDETSEYTMEKCSWEKQAEEKPKSTWGGIEEVNKSVEKLSKPKYVDLSLNNLYNKNGDNNEE